MANLYAFEDLEIWKESRALLREIRRVCKRENVLPDTAFIDQITRSTRSISANIAEGSDAMTIPETISFLGYAKRSATETRSHLYDALDEQYIARPEFDFLSNWTRKLASMIAKFIHHLQSRNQKFKKTFKQQPRISESANQRL